VSNLSKQSALAKYLPLVLDDGLNIMYIPKVDQYEEICLAAIRQNWESISYIENLTDQICLEAINHNPEAISLIKNYSNKLLARMIEINPMVEVFLSPQRREEFHRYDRIKKSIKNL